MSFDTFLIVGGNFNNKGAEAMMYIAICEIRRRFPQAEIYTLVGNAKLEEKKHSNLRTVFIEDNVEVRRYLARDFRLEKIKSFLKYCILNMVTGDLKKIEKIYNQILTSKTAIVDISGYGLASNWPIAANMNYINLIRYAKKHNTTVYLFPQSFGPFEYNNSKVAIEKYIKEYLPYCKTIFAREKEGADLLQNKYGLSNVRVSTDLVLENKNLDFSLVFSHRPSLIYPKATGKFNIAVLPNYKLLENKTEKEVISFFVKAIEGINVRYKIYLVSHAHEDLELCRKIKSYFEDSERVELVEQELNCLEYSAFVTQMNFAIASRYHSIVHAYKNDVPCIVLGWATKYVELLALFEQNNYMLDIRKGIGEEKLVSAIKEMEERYLLESQKISSIRKVVQGQNCFDILMEE